MTLNFTRNSVNKTKRISRWSEQSEQLMTGVTVLREKLN